ncbi:MAG TPA: hypothetical protein VIK14_08860 [Ignavibacteria bacterium]
METQKLIEILSLSFSVQDIMVKEKNIQCANKLTVAKEIAKKNNFSIIPRKNSRNIIKKYFDIQSEEEKNISYEDIISSDTPINDLIELFKDKKCFFVLGSNKIIGLVHFTDLNNPIVKLFIYLLIERIEWSIYYKINKMEESDLLNKLRPSLAKKANERKKRDRTNDMDNKWFGVFKFKELIKIAVAMNLITIKPDIVGKMNDMRNKIAHTQKFIIDDNNKSFIDLLRVITSCYEILIKLERTH